MDKKKFVSALLMLVISSFIGFLLGASYIKTNSTANLFDLFFRNPESNYQNNESAPEYKTSTDYEQSVIDAVKNASPAVISIIISKDLPIIENCPFNPFFNFPDEFQDFFQGFNFNQKCQTGKTQKKEIGGGSGFIVSKDGLIVTNKHVVSDDAASYTVLTNDGKKYNAKVLAKDPVQDLAIVKINAPKDLPVIKIGNSDSVQLGQTAIAIGNALGEFRNTVSIGIISGLSRSIDASSANSLEHLDGLIQTDAGINPGNSGGPLINLRGEVIGINTAVAQNAENIGFAIPINQAKRDIKSVEKTGKIEVPFLGVRYIMINDEIAEKENLPIKYGALIRGSEDGPGVIKNSPADKAGLLAEDIITEINKEKINSDKGLINYIQKYNVGDEINLKILRNNKEINLKLVLESRK